MPPQPREEGEGRGGEGRGGEGRGGGEGGGEGRGGEGRGGEGGGEGRKWCIDGGVSGRGKGKEKTN